MLVLASRGDRLACIEGEKQPAASWSRRQARKLKTRATGTAQKAKARPRSSRKAKKAMRADDRLERSQAPRSFFSSQSQEKREKTAGSGDRTHAPESLCHGTRAFKQAARDETRERHGRRKHKIGCGHIVLKVPHPVRFEKSKKHRATPVLRSVMTREPVVSHPSSFPFSSSASKLIKCFARVKMQKLPRSLMVARSTLAQWSQVLSQVVALVFLFLFPQRSEAANQAKAR